MLYPFGNLSYGKLILYANAKTFTSSVADFALKHRENRLVVGICFQHFVYFKGVVLMRWLHVSDIHSNPGNMGRSTKQLRDELPDYLRTLSKRGKIDAMFVTGDFRQAGVDGDEAAIVADAVGYMRKLADSVGVSHDNIHIVPGNHDLQRFDNTPANPAPQPSLRLRLLPLLSNLDNTPANRAPQPSTDAQSSISDIELHSKILAAYNPDEGQFLLEKNAQKAREFLWKPFSFFRHVYKELHPSGDLWPDKLQSIHRYRCYDEYSLLYMNTAISCHRKEDRGELLIGNDDLCEALKGIKTTNANKPIIALAHHGLGLFSEPERRAVEQLFREYGVTVCLCGDAHVPYARRSNETIEITAGSIKHEGVPSICIGQLQARKLVQAQAHQWGFTLARPKWMEDEDFNSLVMPKLPGAQGSTAAGAKTIVGRDDEIDKIRDFLLEPGNPIAIEVQGPPGIGKTTVCRAALERLRREDDKVDGKDIFVVDLTAMFSKASALTAILEAFGVKHPQRLDEEMEALYQQHPGCIVYLDNMEDPLRDDEYRRWFASFLKDSGWKVLYSSRRVVDMSREIIEHTPVPQLKPEDARKMFLAHWRKDIPDSDRQALDELLRCLDYHPLPIRLVAAQKRRFPTIQRLLGQWKKKASKIAVHKDDDSSHGSWPRAVWMSFDAVSSNKEALVLWGVMSFLPSLLSYRLFEMMFAHDFEAYELAADVLIDNGLLEAATIASDREKDGDGGDNTNDYADGRGDGYAMLATVKEMAFEYDLNGQPGSADLLRGECVEILRRALVEVFKRGNDRKAPDRLRWLYLAIACLPIALAFMRKIGGDAGRNNPLILAMTNHYSYSASMSLDVLHMLDRQDVKSAFGAIILRSMGILATLLGKHDEARSYLEEAVALFQQEGNDLGQANALYGLGVLESIQNQLVKAQSHYTQAEQLYRTEKGNSNIGLANTLHGIGAIALQLDQPENALSYFNQALALFYAENGEHGQANTLMCIGQSEMLRGNLDIARSHLEQALERYQTLRVDLGLANTSRFLGELAMKEGNLCEARNSYKQAEEKYDSVEHKLGLAYVSFEMGDLEASLGNYVLAIAHYEKAAPLFEAERNFSWKSYTLSKLCLAYAHTGNKTKALQTADKARESLKQVPDELREDVESYVNQCINEAMALLSPPDANNKNLSTKPTTTS